VFLFAGFLLFSREPAVAILGFLVRTRRPAVFVSLQRLGAMASSRAQRLQASVLSRTRGQSVRDEELHRPVRKKQVKHISINRSLPDGKSAWLGQACNHQGFKVWGWGQNTFLSGLCFCCMIKTKVLDTTKFSGTKIRGFLHPNDPLWLRAWVSPRWCQD